MPIHRISLYCKASLTALLLLTAVATAQPQLDFTSEDVGTGPLPSHVRDSIDRYISDWSEVMAETDSDSEVAEARNRILEGFGRHADSTRYRHAYATAVTEHLSPVLGVEEMLKQVNAGIVFSQIQHMAVRPALDEMVRHPNPAVRYLGWRGYLRIRNTVLAQGRDYSEPMIESLDERAAAEDVPFVVRRLLEMLYFPPVRPQIVSQSDYDWAMRQTLEIFLDSWQVQCRRMLNGKPEMVEAVERGLLALMGFERVVGEDQDEKVKLVQALLDAMDGAARVFDEAEGDDDQLKIQRLREASTSLLRASEQHINSLTELQESPVYDALTESGVADRGASVRQAVLDWADDLRDAGFDVEDPRLQPLEAASSE